VTFDPNVPIIVASENGRRGAKAAMELLMNGGSALDAVELACRIVEDDPADHSVGYGGLPNVVGDVELDASIMDGRTLQSGAVAAIHGYANPITLARRVMEQTPHVLLVGRGAECFAAEMGFQRANQRTEEAVRRWEARFEERNILRNADVALRNVAAQMTAPLNLQDHAANGERIDTLGTVNFLARDLRGNLASGVSTSGIGWKYPGRVGDSPLIGAGNYCDNRYGGVACTGMGELAIRASTARSLVLYLKGGMSLREAGAEALRDLAVLDARAGQYMNIVAMDAAGNHAGFTTVPGKQYLYMTGEMDEPALAERYALAPQPEG
jgi:beta-aspartyl-peptidase (threonine type)